MACSKTYCFCNMSYIGDIGQTLGTRLDEDKREVETMTTRHFTRDKRQWLTNVEHKSAITDHADRLDCVIDWRGESSG